MRAITLFRAIAWLGVAIVFWSLNVRWGSNMDVGAGPPAGWHRTVVGAALLTMIAALLLSISGRRGNPPSWIARAVSGACAGAVLLIAWYLRAQAEGPFADAIQGPGWVWLLAGGGLITSAVVGTLGLKTQVKKSNKRERRRAR